MLALCACCLAAQLMAEPALDLGARRELFVDAYLIDHLDGLALRLHEPQPANTALAFDKPWEGPFCGYVTVFHQDDRYWMYYRGLPVAGKDGSDTEVTCLAQSSDGITFEKPSLGLFEVGGSRDNNVILAGMAPYSHNFAPFLDTRPGVPEDERFKALAGTSQTGLAAFASSDGRVWRKIQEEPVLTGAAYDSQNVAFWSEHEKCYVAYFRSWSEGTWGGFRWVSRSTSPDFRNWTPSVEMDKGDAPWEHIYTNQTLPYFRAPHLYISLAARFMPGRRVVSEAEAARLGVDPGYFGDCSDNILMTSRGGNKYDRTFTEGYLKPGIGLENWTSRTNYPARGIVPTGDREISVYVQHNYAQPTAYLRRYFLRPDGFASINAPYAGGEWLSKPLTFSGKALHINFATSAAGSIRVELQNEAGAALPGFESENCDEIIGNLIDRAVTWKGNPDLSALAGQTVRLRFVMKDADLYSLCFE